MSAMANLTYTLVLIVMAVFVLGAWAFIIYSFMGA